LGHGLFHCRVHRHEHPVWLAPALEPHESILRSAQRRLARIDHETQAAARINGAFEVGVSLLLLIGAGLLVRSFIRLERTSPGFRSENVLAAFMSLPVAQYREPAKGLPSHDQCSNACARYGRTLRCNGRFPSLQGRLGSGGVEIAGHPRSANEPRQIIWQTRTSPGFFETLGIPLARGRDITASDEQGSPGAAVIDEIVAQKLFPNVDPLGMQIIVPLPEALSPSSG